MIRVGVRMFFGIHDVVSSLELWNCYPYQTRQSGVGFRIQSDDARSIRSRLPTVTTKKRRMRGVSRGGNAHGVRPACGEMQLFTACCVDGGWACDWPEAGWNAAKSGRKAGKKKGDVRHGLSPLSHLWAFSPLTAARTAWVPGRMCAAVRRRSRVRPATDKSR